MGGGWRFRPTLGGAVDPRGAVASVRDVAENARNVSGSARYASARFLHGPLGARSCCARCRRLAVGGSGLLGRRRRGDGTSRDADQYGRRVDHGRLDSVPAASFARRPPSEGGRLRGLRRRRRLLADHDARAPGSHALDRLQGGGAARPRERARRRAARRGRARLVPDRRRHRFRRGLGARRHRHDLQDRSRDEPDPQRDRDRSGGALQPVDRRRLGLEHRRRVRRGLAHQPERPAASCVASRSETARPTWSSAERRPG